MIYRQHLKDTIRIVVKIGTSSLTYPNGRLNFKKIERIAMILSDLRNQGKEMLLVTSGAIGVGSGKLGMLKRPDTLSEKQAIAAIGQTELMKIYQKFFERYNQYIAQILLTRDIMNNPTRRENAQRTFNTLVEMKVIPVINENDTIATEEIEFGDNDTLSAYVAKLVNANLLILLTDINGLYSADPKVDPSAKIISTVNEITPEIDKLAGSKGSEYGTGGMVTKIQAAKICRESNIDTIIANGKDPYIINNILSGQKEGTLFLSNEKLELYQ